MKFLIRDAIQEIYQQRNNGMITSKHLVTDVTLYEESYRKGFSEFYGNIEDYVVLALLPPIWKKVHR
jgi:predicted house-cleaning noncanonical NTP pyrophosphatase (MazG superfamily)